MDRLKRLMTMRRLQKISEEAKTAEVQIKITDNDAEIIARAMLKFMPSMIEQELAFNRFLEDKSSELPNDQLEKIEEYRVVFKLFTQFMSSIYGKTIEEMFG